MTTCENGLIRQKKHSCPPYPAEKTEPALTCVLKA